MCVRVLYCNLFHPQIILSGKGLKEAEVDKPAIFYMDGTKANTG